MGVAKLPCPSAGSAFLLIPLCPPHPPPCQAPQYQGRQKPKGPVPPSPPALRPQGLAADDADQQVPRPIPPCASTTLVQAPLPSETVIFRTVNLMVPNGVSAADPGTDTSSDSSTESDGDSENGSDDSGSGSGTASDSDSDSGSTVSHPTLLRRRKTSTRRLTAEHVQLFRMRYKRGTGFCSEPMQK